MDAAAILEGIWNSPEKYNGSERREFIAAMRDKLEQEGKYVADDDKELRELAIANTDLAAPEDDEE